jgi:hypothetical protein
MVTEGKTVQTDKASITLSAAALIIGNPVSRITGNFFTGINRTAVPARLFADAKEAVKWLSDFT